MQIKALKHYMFYHNYFANKHKIYSFALMKDLTIGKESKLIFNFAVPMLLGNVFQQVYNITDSIIVGKFLGTESLAAVGASFPIIFTLIALVIGIGSGASTIISQYYGAKDMENVKKSIDTIYIVLFFASIVITSFGILFSKELFQLLQLPAEIIPQASTYLNIYLGGMIFAFGFNAISSILRGLGDSKTPLYFLIFSTLLNVVFDLIFVLVFKWGIAGAAIATVIAQAAAFISLLLYLNKTNEIMLFSLRNIKFDKTVFKHMVRIGLPSGLQQTFVALGMMALISIVNKFGTNVIAAYTVAGRIDSLAAMPAMNFSAALSSFIGQNLGANKLSRVIKGFKATLIMSSIVSVVVSVIVILFSTSLMSLFTNDSEVIRIGHEYLIIVSSFYLFFSTMFVTSGVLRGAGDTIIPMFITLFSLWIIRIPLASILSSRVGEVGIWWAIPIAWFLGMTGSYFYYKMGKWKTKGVVKQSPVIEDIIVE